MNATAIQIERGRSFAAALDACDYARAASVLAEDCRYMRPQQVVVVGPRAICESYRESDTNARRKFDAVAYRSKAETDSSGGVRLTFSDDLCYRGATHIFNCTQIVYFDENQLIDRIELVELPGERERLAEFCALHKIRLQ